MPSSRLRATFNLHEDLLRAADKKAREGDVSRSRAVEIALAQAWGLPAPDYPDAEGARKGGPRNAPSNVRAAAAESDEGEPASELEDDSQPASSQPDASPQRPAARGSEEPKKDDEPEEVP